MIKCYIYWLDSDDIKSLTNPNRRYYFGNPGTSEILKSSLYDVENTLFGGIVNLPNAEIGFPIDSVKAIIPDTVGVVIPEDDHKRIFTPEENDNISSGWRGRGDYEKRESEYYLRTNWKPIITDMALNRVVDSAKNFYNGFAPLFQTHLGREATTFDFEVLEKLLRIAAQTGSTYAASGWINVLKRENKKIYYHS